jgi:hypothetical protein
MSTSGDRVDLNGSARDGAPGITTEIPNKVEAAMARVRVRVPSAQGSVTPALDPRQRPGDAYLFPEDVYRNLHQARTLGGNLRVEYKLGWRTPLIGPIWMRVRQRIHQEIRIYIDSMTAYQNNLSTHLVRSIVQIVETLDSLGLRALRRQQLDQAAALDALRDEVRALTAQVADLEGRLERGDRS